MATARSARSTPDSDVPPLSWVPTRVFFVSGVGTHAMERVALQHAMREAGVADGNLLKVSSVIAPGCRIIPADEGRRLLRPGNMVYAVIATAQTDEPHQRVTTALAWAKPEKPGVPGYIAELEEEMAEGARSAGMPPDRVWSFDDEAAAVAAAMDVMQPGDVIVLIADDAAAVREQLRPHLHAEQATA
jgi:pyruvoyl-dependent arginine decarboxylase